VSNEVAPVAPGFQEEATKNEGNLGIDDRRCGLESPKSLISRPDYLREFLLGMAWYLLAITG
jgi:hypothetical protein